MKICRLDQDRLGVYDGGEIVDVTEALAALPSVRWPLPQHDLMIGDLQRIRSHAERLVSTGERRSAAAARFCSPVANPSKIIGAPANYRAHIDEANGDPAVHGGTPVHGIDRYGLFLKANTSLIGPGQPVRLGDSSRRHDHEIELAIVIGRRTSHVDEATALSNVAGYSIGLDMTVRGTEDRSLRKSLDSYSVLGPWLVTADEIPNPDALDLSLKVNGELRQSSNTSKMIFSTARLISYASRFYTLLPGDIIMTGTPEGIGPVAPGDVMEAAITGIGSMTVRIEPGVT